MSFLAALLALAPGFHAWWSGRALLARVDDPAFPELVLARSQRSGQLAVAAAVVLAFIPSANWLWAFPLFVLAVLVGNFPFRRALYGETWSVVDYVRASLFGFVGTAGFWIFLAFAPALILSLIQGWIPTTPVESAAVLGAVLAIALLGWEYAYPRLWLALHRASPLRRADIEPRFEDIVRRSAVAQRPPQVFRFGAPGAYVMNAFALPSARQPRVVFGDTLLELLTPDEIVAVFAHEVSHLEHYDRRRLLRIRLVTYLLALGGTMLPAVLLATVPVHAWTVKLVWPIVVLALLALRVSKSQAHETESDLRAGTLTGDPEAMIRALTKLHHYSRMPRRWPYDFERAASHPSLARRIQALRTQGTAATTPASVSQLAQLGAPTILRSPEPGAYAALDDSRAYWLEGVPADAAVDSMAALREHAASYRAVAYADLTELRVAVVRGGRRALLARDRSGKTWSMPLRTDDVAAAQRALDVLDVRLGHHVREDWATKGRVIATLLALALVGALDFSWPWIPLIVTLVKPGPASVAAMGAMTVSRVIIGAVAGTLGATTLGISQPLAWLSMAAMFAIGVWACRLAWRWTRGDERPARQSFTLATLACLATLLVGALAMTRMYGSSGVALPSLPSQGPSGALALLMLGVAAALVTYRDNLRRRSGAALGALAVVVAAGAVGGEQILTRAGGPGIAWTTGRAEVAGRFDAGGSVAYRLHLSPSGQRFAVQGPGRRPARYEDSGDDQAVSVWRFTIASVGGARRTTEAFDLAFLDDERLLVLRPSPGSSDSLEIAVERAEGRDAARPWRRAIPAYFAPTLAIDRVAGTWRVAGHDVRAGTVVTSAGKIGSDSVSTTELPGAVLGGRPLHTYRDGTSLVATLHGSYGARQMLLAMFGFYPFRWDVWHVGNGERRIVGALPGLPECGAAGERDERVLCMVRGRSGVSLWKVDARGAGGSPASLGALPLNFDLWDIGTDGQVAAAARDGSALVVVDASSGRGIRIALGGGVRLQSAQQQPLSTDYATDVALVPGVVAILVVGDRKSEVVFYRLR